jgi:MYXO-CTERM domain-containing protein
VRTAAVGLAVVLFAGSARAADAWSDPFPGVKRLHRTGGNQNINALVVDLCAAGVSVRATATGERGRRVSSFASAVGAQAAINGDFFSSGYSTDGLAMSGGALWPGESDHGYVGPIAFGDRRVALIPHEVVAGPEPWMREIVSGHPTLIAGGALRDNNGDTGLCTARHPRTAVGLSEDKTKLFMVVVDGRSTTRIGMTCGELGNLMKELGAHDALNLDGGGSSAMVIGGAVANNPSDGSERIVANHLAIYAKGSGDPSNCPIPRWGAQYVGDSGWPGGTSMTLPINGAASGCIELKNIGTETWSPGKTFLGTTKERDRKSAVRGADWVSDNRAATIDKDVPRGATGKFCFSFKAPATVGTITEYFGLVQEGVTWFADSGGPADEHIWFKITTNESTTPMEDAAVASDAGALPEDASAPVAADVSDIEGGCGCRAAGHSTSSPWILFLGLLAVRTRRPATSRSRDRPSA